MADGETAKAPDLNSVAINHGFAHGVQYGLDGNLGVFMGKLSELSGQRFYQIASGHGVIAGEKIQMPDVSARK